MLRKFVSFVLSVCIIFSCLLFADDFVAETSAATNIYNLATNVQDGQILQCWNWSFNNIKNNMVKIAEQGFTAIQTSPIQASKESTKESWSTASNSFWVYYQPINFSIETNSRNALGTKSEFKAMCDEAHKYGIKVIVDTVFNHLANNNSDNSLSTQIPSDIRNDSGCWHSVTTNISNYSDRYDMTHHCLAGLPDLNTGSSKVQNYAISFLKECIDCGADGFRFDAAKHIETPSDNSGISSSFWSNVLNSATSYAQSTRGFTPYYYGEVLDSAGIDINAYTKYMSVTDNSGSNSIRNAINSSNSSSAANSAIFNGAQPKYTVQWNESHDTYAEGSSSYVSNTNLKKTWAIIGSRAEVCGMYLARPSSGSTKLGAADVTSWADKEVKEINHFKNSFIGQSEYFASSGNIAYVERGTSGVVLVNVSGSSASVNVTANRIASGTYKDAISGNTFTVSNGKITGNIGSTGIAVVYNKSEVIIPTETPTTPPPVLSGKTKTVTIGVIKYISETPTLHYWNDEGVQGDVELTATNETSEYSVGSDYWNGASKLFYIYTAQVPVEATSIKTFTSSTNSDWAEEDVLITDDKILLVFEYDNLYHNVLSDLTTYEPTEPPSEVPTQIPTEAPTEPPTSLQPGYYLVGTFNGIQLDSISTLSDERRLLPNVDVDGEYILYWTFFGGDVLKVVYFDGVSITDWFKPKSESFYKIGATSDKVGDCIVRFNPDGNDSWSYNYLTVKRVDNTIPEIVKKVEGITANPTDTNISFTWDLVENAVKYWVYKYDPIKDSWSSAASSYGDSAVVKLLDPDTEYKFKIICKLSDNTVLSLNDADVVTVKSLKPIATSDISVVSGITEATVSWNEIEGAQKYWVYKATSSNGPFYIYSSSDECSLTVRKLRPDTEYFFKVVALTNNNGIMTISKPEYSPTCSVVTDSANKITTINTTVSSNNATISWPAFENADKYWIMYSTTSGNTDNASEWKTITSVTDLSELTYTFNNLESNTTYYLTVCARYNDNGVIRTINYIPVKIRTHYSDYQYIDFTEISDTSIKLTFPDDVNAQKMWIYVYDATGMHVTTVSTTTNSVIINSLENAESCTYAVYVLDSNGDFGYITPTTGYPFK